MDNLEFIYSLFNQYLFTDAKNNISTIQYYVDTNYNLVGNKLVGELVNAIKNYDLGSIDLPLLNTIMMRTGKTQSEAQHIISEIAKWKSYDRKQIEPSRKYLEDVISGSIIQKANNLFPNNPSEYIKFIKNSEIKTTTSESITSIEFDKLDINSILADEGNDSIPSCFDFINRSYPGNGYPRAQMVIVSMPPGCFTGDTKIYTKDGIKTIEELCGKTDIEVYSFNGTKKVKSVAERCIKTKEVTELIEIQTNDGGIIESTEDHRFLLSDNNYKEAKDLKIGDELMSFSDSYLNIVVMSKKKINLEKPEPVYDLVNVELYSNFAIMTSENTGIFVHNCGKSLFLEQEMLNMAINGYKCHMLVLGDIGVKDIIIRLCSVYSGLPFKAAQENIRTIYNGLCQMIGDKLQLTVLPAGVLTVDEYIDFIKDKDYDVLGVDYDSNFKANFSENNMYNVYGEIYEKLTILTKRGFLLFVLSQSKVGCWRNPEIELNEIGESSRKQSTSDGVITRGKEPGSPNHLGIFKIVKNRRGEVDIKEYSIRLNNGRFMTIPRGVYDQLKSIPDKKDFTAADIEGMITQYKAQYNNVNRQINQAAQQYGGGQPISGPTPFGRP